jgi:DNA replication and repair protein RecF
MYLTHLSLTNFRLFSRLDMDVPRRILLLVGANAQGKTSILESVYYLATFNSFHAASDRQLLNFIASEQDLCVGRIVASFQRDERLRKLEVRLIQEPSGNGSPKFRKEVLLDGVKAPANQVIGQFNAVLFMPQMTRIIESGPEERRRYLNFAISQTDPLYMQALSEYNQALTQRNALLKLLGERSGDLSQLSFWDGLLASRAALLIHARSKALDEMEALAVRVHERLTRGREVFRIRYLPSYDPLPVPKDQFTLPLQAGLSRSGYSHRQIEEGFLEQLTKARAEEIARGITTIGPHRDEFRISVNGIDLGDYGSRGQIRTAILSLKMAEVDWIRARTKQWPVLLLDETLAELDFERRQSLVEYLENADQVLLTTTDFNLFPENFAKRCEKWQVSQGMVEKVSAD